MPLHGLECDLGQPGCQALLQTFQNKISATLRPIPYHLIVNTLHIHSNYTLEIYPLLLRIMSCENQSILL